MNWLENPPIPQDGERKTHPAPDSSASSQRTRRVDPSFAGTSLDSPITKVGIPLIGVDAAGNAHPSGTATVVAPGLAFTARHVLKDYLEMFEAGFERRARADGTIDRSFRLLSLVSIDEPRFRLPVEVWLGWYIDPIDIAVLYLKPAGEPPPGYSIADLVWGVPRLDLLPPKPGSEIAAFGFPRSNVEPPSSNPFDRTLNTDASTSSGEVLEVHHLTRDSALLPFPCFRTNARIDGGMSGGPVFNDAGHLCGIVCSSVAPYAEADGHISYVSTLWPVLATPVSFPWDKYPQGSRFPLYEFAKAGHLETIGLEHVSLREGAEGTWTVVAHYDPSLYSSPSVL